MHNYTAIFIYSLLKCCNPDNCFDCVKDNIDNGRRNTGRSKATEDFCIETSRNISIFFHYTHKEEIESNNDCNISRDYYKIKHIVPCFCLLYCVFNCLRLVRQYTNRLDQFLSHTRYDNSNRSLPKDFGLAYRIR